MPSSWICPDASFVVYLVSDPRKTELRQLWQRWHEQGLEAVAPSLVYFEVANAIYRLEKYGLFDATEAKAALEAALALPVRLVAEPTLHHQAVRIARRFALSTCYDAHYLALAERLGADFWTCDGKLAKSVTRELPWVHLAAART